MKKEETIRSPHHEELRKDLIQRTKGDILKCFGCGTCTASCPVMRIDNKYNPRKIVRMMLLGVDVLDEDFIWLCSTCYTCYERCPQDVKLTEVMDALKNMAVERGYIHGSLKKQIELLGEHGRLYAVGEFDNKKRMRGGLPEIHMDNKNIQCIFKISKLNKLLGKDEQ
ncbi:MAG: hypothetical protein A7316_05185 [Candidatus Altiarchaeales archaeon WOR_SM1_86-2]|nr:MAG: hypothetical protein A7316_05185 [Candidatus Altiarchaeales archaeon WOR_SM1_86-2]